MTTLRLLGDPLPTTVPTPDSKAALLADFFVTRQWTEDRTRAFLHTLPSVAQRRPFSLPRARDAISTAIRAVDDIGRPKHFRLGEYVASLDFSSVHAVYRDCVESYVLTLISRPQRSIFAQPPFTETLRAASHFVGFHLSICESTEAYHSCHQCFDESQARLCGDPESASFMNADLQLCSLRGVWRTLIDDEALMQNALANDSGGDTSSSSSELSQTPESQPMRVSSLDASQTATGVSSTPTQLNSSAATTAPAKKRTPDSVLLDHQGRIRVGALSRQPFDPFLYDERLCGSQPPIIPQRSPQDTTPQRCVSYFVDRMVQQTLLPKHTSPSLLSRWMLLSGFIVPL